MAKASKAHRVFSKRVEVWEQSLISSKLNLITSKLNQLQDKTLASFSDQSKKGV